MSDRTCPNCHIVDPRHLDASSDGPVDFYRCDGCGHVWTVSKDVTQEIRHVTALKPPPSDK